MTSRRALVDQIETVIQQDVGRNLDAVFAATRGGLWDAVTALAATAFPKVGIITGFFVPHGKPPAAETDGPVAAALLALVLSRLGLPCRLLTDQPCQSACKAALEGASVGQLSVDAVGLNEPLAPVIDSWRALDIDWVIAIERCGQTASGTRRNMRGEDISMYAPPLDGVFSAGPWSTVAIGDGGNEIGMGSLPRQLIEAQVKHGPTIACITPADYLVTAGISHWGVYALMAGLAVVRPEWHDVLVDCLDSSIEAAILERMVRDGPAVDGVTLRQEPTIDGFDLPTHRGKVEAIRALMRVAD